MLSWKRLHWLTKIFLVLKAAKYDIQKPSTCSATFFRCKFWSMFRVFHLAWSTCRATKTFVADWRKLLRKVERRSTLSNKLWLCCSFFIKLKSCHATNSLMLRDKLKVFVSGISPPLQDRLDFRRSLEHGRVSPRKSSDPASESSFPGNRQTANTSFVCFKRSNNQDSTNSEGVSQKYQRSWCNNIWSKQQFWISLLKNRWTRNRRQFEPQIPERLLLGVYRPAPTIPSLTLK